MQENEGDFPSGGTNFLVSAVLILKQENKKLRSEVDRLAERVSELEVQNAAFLDVSATRLLQVRAQ